MDNQNLHDSVDNTGKNPSKVFICHRLPERTFKIKDYYFPVCSRCTGIYMGTFSYYIFVYFTYVQYDLMIILTAVLMILPTFSDGLTQFLGFRKSNNSLRFFTGLIAGIGIGILIKSIKRFLIS